MYLQKPKKRSNKIKPDSKIIQRNDGRKDKRNRKEIVSNNSDNCTIIGKHFITCRSCFWYYPVDNYFKKGVDNQQQQLHRICPLCASSNIKYLEIPYDGLFKYILTNIN